MIDPRRWLAGRRVGVARIAILSLLLIVLWSGTIGASASQVGWTNWRFLKIADPTVGNGSYGLAANLYRATSQDAQTFEAALLIPEIRLKLEAALHQQLSNEMLRHLANQSKEESLYWYKYMQGLEHKAP